MNTTRIGQFSGTFKMLRPKVLIVDHQYQRELHGITQIEKIAHSFKWASFGCISVMKRGQKYYVTDGQRRLEAVKFHPEIHEVPCVVHKSTGQVEEAQTFSDINVVKMAVSSIDKFRSRVTGEELLAVELYKILRENGWDYDRQRGPMILSCISEVERTYRQFGPDILSNVLIFMGTHHEGLCNRDVFAGLSLLEYSLVCEKGQSILNDALAKKICGYKTCYRRIADEIGGAIGTRSSKMKAKALLDLINRGKRTNRLKLKLQSPKGKDRYIVSVEHVNTPE